MADDLRPQQLDDAVRAWACWSGSADDEPAVWQASLRWLVALWDEGDEHLALGLVHDLGLLLLRGRDFNFASSRWLAAWPEEERAARLRYEDHVLGRWALDPSVLDAHVALSGLPVLLRDAALAHAVGLALGDRLRGMTQAVLGNPATLRSRLVSLADGLVARPPRDAAHTDPAWREWARVQLDESVARLGAARLFAPEQLWELAHWEQLPGPASRLALRQLNGLCARIGPVEAAVALSVRRRAREVPVEANEADHYPAGGFDAVSTRGTFENLVRSEVAYVGEGCDGLSGVDLFDVRFAESELLYYTRDESPMLDARRALTVVLDGPASLRTKHPDAPAQTLLMLGALALSLQADLLRLFGPQGAGFALVLRARTPADEAVAQEEHAMFALVLASELAHRRATLSTLGPATAQLPAGTLLWCTSSDDAPDDALVLRTAGATWTLGEARFEVSEGPAMLRAVGDAVLEALARGSAPGRKAR